MRIYLAGPLFTYGEKAQNERLAMELRNRGHDVFVPQETEANTRKLTAGDIFRADRDGVDWCDWIVACIDGPDPDSGTSWELGYAHAKGKRALLYRTDFRTACGDYDGQPVNLMLTVGAHWLTLDPTWEPHPGGIMSSFAWACQRAAEQIDFVITANKEINSCCE